MILYYKKYFWYDNIMITKEVNNWLRNVECGNYSMQDALEEFAKFAKYLTREEAIMIKRRLLGSVKK